RGGGLPRGGVCRLRRRDPPDVRSGGGRVSPEEPQPGAAPGPEAATGAAGSAAGGSGEAGDPGSGRTPPPGEPTEEELRAAYEAELSRISSADMMLQATVSLLNIGRLRLGARGAQAAEGGSEGAGAADLEQVRGP